MTSLPSGWITTTIGQINVYSGSTVDPLKAPDQVFELYSVPAYPTRKAEIVSGHKIGSSKQLLEPDDVLLCKINPRINRVWKTSPRNIWPQIGSSEWIVIRQPLINPDFLRYQLSEDSFRELLCAEVSGVGGSLTRAQPKKVASYRIILPSLAEQNRITQIVNDSLAKVETIKARIETISRLLKRFRQSVLETAFTDLRSKNNEKSDSAHNLNCVPFSSVIDDLRYGTAQKCEYNGGTTGVLRIPNIGDDGIDISDLKSSSFSDNELNKLALLEGDILLIRSNGSIELVGKSAVVSQKEEGLLFAGYLIRIRLDRKRAHPAYVNYWLKSPSTRQSIELISRSTNGVNNINSSEIKSLEFPIATLDKQIETADKIEKLFTFADQLDSNISMARARVSQLTQSILAKAMNGELTIEWREENPDLISGQNSAKSLIENIQLELLNKSKPRRAATKKTTGPAMSKEVIKVLDALKESDKPLTGQQLLAAAGYPLDSSTELLEQFFLDIRESINKKEIIRLSRDKNGQDRFALAAAQK